MIKNWLTSFLGNTLLKGSFIVLSASLIANFGNYLFHLFMGRMLGPADYGVLESLISISYFLSIPISVIGLVVVKFVSQNNKNKEIVYRFVQKIFKKVSVYGFLALVVFLAAFPLLRRLIKVDSFFLFLSLGIFSYLGVLSVVYTSALQGLLRFFEVGLLNILSSWLKLVFGVILLIFGLRVVGAVNSFVLGTLAVFILGVTFFKKFIPKATGEIKIKNLFGNIKSYSLAVLLSNVASTSLFTTDIILARYYLSPVAAGQYASLSVLGKIIYFASGPVVSVMFPLVSERHANGKNYRKLFGASFLIVLTISAFVSAVYFVFPELMVSLLFGNAYLEIASSLGLFAVSISLYSLCALFVSFFLCIFKTKVIYFSTICAIMQIFLINIFHQNIQMIIYVNIFTFSLLLLSLLVYFVNKVYLKN